MREGNALQVFYDEKLVGTLAMTADHKAAFQYSVDPLLQLADGAGEALAEVRQRLGVHQKAPLLHPGQYQIGRAHV